jgi:hypothetical protein
MKFDIYFKEIGFHLSHLDPKFKGNTMCVPVVGDFIDYELQYKEDCVIISCKVVERIHYLQDDLVMLKVKIPDKEVLDDLVNYLNMTTKFTG